MYAKSRIMPALCAVALVFSLSFAAFADTIRLKDGTTVKGKVIGFKDQQFIVLIGDGSRGGRRSQLQLFIEDVESIEFDDAGGASAVKQTSEIKNEPPAISQSSSSTVNPRQQTPSTTSSNLPPPQRTNTNSGSLSQVLNSQPVSAPKTSGTESAKPPTVNPSPSTKNAASTGKFFSLPLKVLADSTSNGWTNAGIVVRKGQRIRVSATGRISLGTGRFATPAGVGSIADSQRLMPTEPTGALIAVIGDDNNDFIFIGSNREFVAQRDGTLFLGINEGNLDDNSGAFDVVIEAEAVDTTAKR